MNIGTKLNMKLICILKIKDREIPFLKIEELVAFAKRNFLIEFRDFFNDIFSKDKSTEFIICDSEKNIYKFNENNSLTPVNLDNVDNILNSSSFVIPLILYSENNFISYGFETLERRFVDEEFYSHFKENLFSPIKFTLSNNCYLLDSDTIDAKLLPFDEIFNRNMVMRKSLIDCIKMIISSHETL